MQAREDIADFLDALLWVYTICIFGYIVSSLILSFGIRLPYSRILDAVLSFLRDVSEPFLRVFRRLGLQIGPLDLSPIVAILVLRVVGGLVVGLIRP
jgi:YggT family protein